jgi:ABC-type amino acid transport substrate-binding protein
MRGRSTWLLGLLAVLLALALAGCGDDEQGGGGGGEQAAQPSRAVEEFPPDSPLGRIQQAGRMTIGVKYDVPPFGFRNPQTGDVEGFDVELGRAIAADLGVEPRFIEAVSDNRIPFLQDRTADLIISTMTINQERDQEIDFSTPYYVAQGRILVPQDSDIQGVDDLAGRRVCTALGSTYEETIREQAPRAELRLVDSYSECLELLQNGAVDAVSTDDVILTGMIIQDDTLKLVGGELTTEPYGVGIREGAREMKEFVDGVLERYKQDGRWQRSYQRWVGQYTNEPQEPPTMTLQEALELSE